MTDSCVNIDSKIPRIIAIYCRRLDHLTADWDPTCNAYVEGRRSTSSVNHVLHEVGQLSDALSDVIEGEVLRSFPEPRKIGTPSPCELLQRGYVDQSIMKEFDEGWHLLLKEPLVIPDAVAAQRGSVRFDPLLEELEVRRSASSEVMLEARTLSTRPLRVWCRVFHSSIASNDASGTVKARFGPSARMFRSESVTRVAISMIEQFVRSNPVISRSIQTIRSRMPMPEWTVIWLLRLVTWWPRSRAQPHHGG